MTDIDVFSPAKINLSLAITGKRPDGFHNLVSLVAPVAFGDSIRVSLDRDGNGIELASSDASLPAGEENIAWRAADRFLRAFSLSGRIRIRIEKRIPVGAGFGGGSSNAAAVLLALAKGFGVDDVPRLEAIAAELGSDCPLFLRPEPLLMRGRGEKIERLEPAVAASVAGRSLVLFKPCFGISTAWAYKVLASAGARAYADEKAVEEGISAWKAGRLPLESLLMNSFDAVVGEKYPALPLLLEKIRSETGCPCLMSGSGSGCFALCEPEGVARVRSLIAECWGASAFIEATRIIDIGLTVDAGLSF